MRTLEETPRRTGRQEEPMKGLPVSDFELRRIMYAWSPERNDRDAAPVVLHLAEELARTRELLKRVYTDCRQRLPAAGALAELGREVQTWTGAAGH